MASVSTDDHRDRHRPRRALCSHAHLATPATFVHAGLARAAQLAPHGHRFSLPVEGPGHSTSEFQNRVGNSVCWDSSVRREENDTVRVEDAGDKRHGHGASRPFVARREWAVAGPGATGPGGRRGPRALPCSPACARRAVGAGNQGTRDRASGAQVWVRTASGSTLRQPPPTGPRGAARALGTLWARDRKPVTPGPARGGGKNSSATGAPGKAAPLDCPLRPGGTHDKRTQQADR